MSCTTQWEPETTTTLEPLPPVELVENTTDTNSQFTTSFNISTPNNKLDGRILECIINDDITTFKTLFHEHQAEIVGSCKNPDEEHNLFLLAILQNTNNIAEFLLDQETLIEVLLFPDHGDTKVGNATLLTVAEYGKHKLASLLREKGKHVKSKLTCSGWIKCS